MTDTPRLQMVGEVDTFVCEDGVCDLPETVTAPESTQ